MKIMILANNQAGLYEFRKELLKRLVHEDHVVYVSVPAGDFTDELAGLGVNLIINGHLNRRGTNPLEEIVLLRYYGKLLADTVPDVVLTYTIKPNVYGGLACAQKRIPYISTVTGLGTTIENPGLLQKITLFLYKKGLRHAKKVFFQNRSNLKFMVDHKVVSEDVSEVLPGSGVNTGEFVYEPYPPDDSKVILSTIGRIMKDKGTDEILEAAGRIKKLHPEAIFRLIGDFDGDYRSTVEKACEEGLVEFIPFQKDIKPYLKETHAVLHASYHEGMSNVLLEAASSGRPVIATNVPGCIETFVPGETGIAFEARNAEALADAVDEFLNCPHSAKERMGMNARNKMIREFDRSIIVDRYLMELENTSKE